MSEIPNLSAFGITLGVGQVTVVLTLKSTKPGWQKTIVDDKEYTCGEEWRRSVHSGMMLGKK